MNIQMKVVFILASLGASSAVCAEGLSAQGLDGFLSGAVGYSKSSGSVNPESTIRDLAASVAYTDTSKWGGQLDYVDFRQNFTGIYPKSAATDIAGHLYYRDSAWLLGGLAQKRNFSLDSVSNDVSERFLGIEGQLYRENTTFYGQAGNEKWSDPSGDIRGHFVATKLTYFLGDYMSVGGGIDLVREDTNGYSYSQNNYKLDVENRITDSPFSLYARYVYITERANGGWKADTSMLWLGAKLNFGKATLRTRDREGASLTPAPRVLLF